MTQYVKELDRTAQELRWQKETHEQMFEDLRRVFGETQVYDRSGKLLPAVEVHPESLKKVIAWLKDSQYKADMLDSISGTDLMNFGDASLERLSHPFSCEGESKRLFLLNYTLISTEFNKEYNIKVFLPECRASVDSIDSLFGNANWLEREIFDLLGIDFRGSKDLRRIMMPHDWVGHPLRKDFQEQESYAGMSTSRENPLPALELKGLELRRMVLGEAPGGDKE